MVSNDALLLYIFFGQDEIKMMPRIDLIYSGLRRIWCRWKADDLSFSTTPKLPHAVTYTIDSWQHFDFVLSEKKNNYILSGKAFDANKIIEEILFSESEGETFEIFDNLNSNFKINIVWTREPKSMSANHTKNWNGIVRGSSQDRNNA